MSRETAVRQKGLGGHTIFTQKYLDGDTFGFDRSARIHETVNLAGDIDIGQNCRIDAFVTLAGKVRIGRDCHIGAGVAVHGGSGVIIGDHCGISSGVRIYTGTVDPGMNRLGLHAGSELEPKGGIYAPVDIGNYVTVGANSVVMPGTRIGDEVVVGALSLVRGSLAKGFVYAGIPVRTIGPRTPLVYR